MPEPDRAERRNKGRALHRGGATRRGRRQRAQRWPSGIQTDSHPALTHADGLAASASDIVLLIGALRAGFSSAAVTASGSTSRGDRYRIRRADSGLLATSTCRSNSSADSADLRPHHALRRDDHDREQAGCDFQLAPRWTLTNAAARRVQEAAIFTKIWPCSAASFSCSNAARGRLSIDGWLRVTLCGRVSSAFGAREADAANDAASA